MEEEDYPQRHPVVGELERLKWFLWHGNVSKALGVVQSVEMDLDAAVATSRDNTARNLLKAVEALQTCMVSFPIKTLNHELRAVFRRWYPDFPVEEEEEPQAA
jgi:hypothetical protein